MSDANENWTWWVGRDEEAFTTECGSRDEAVRIAREEYEGAWILEALPPAELRLSAYFDADRFAEDSEDAVYHDHGDPMGDNQIFRLNPDQIKSLQSAVRSAIDHWQDRHGLTFRGFQFSASRNHEYIAGPDEETQPLSAGSQANPPDGKRAPSDEGTLT